MTADELVGPWSLVRFTVEFSDGRDPVFPFGEAAQGRIVYAADGSMSAVLSRGDRSGLGAGLEKAHEASVAAKARAFDTYLSYAGRWRLVGDHVEHDVELALVPDVVGTTQRRRVSWDGETLVLGYERTARSGVERRFRLRWARTAPQETS